MLMFGGLASLLILGGAAALVLTHSVTVAVAVALVWCVALLRYEQRRAAR
jgi:hypothetical protein